MPVVPKRTQNALLAAFIVGAIPLATAQAQALPAAAVAPGDAADREAVALAFVNEHHPELGSLLARLKAMRPSEYAKAVRELWQVSRSLGNVKARDPKRYELGLELWKARSRVDLIAARLAAASPEAAPDVESQLRQAVDAQVAVEARQTRYDRDQAAARLLRLTETLNRLEADPTAIAQARHQALVKKSERARRKAADATPISPKPSPKKGASS